MNASSNAVRINSQVKKVIFLTFLSISGISSYPQSNPRDKLFIIGGGIGYNFSLAGGYVGSHSSPDNISGDYGSWGEGLLVNIDLGVKTCRNLYAMLWLNYLNGRSFESTLSINDLNSDFSYRQNTTNHMRVPLIIELGGRYFIDPVCFSTPGNENSPVNRFVPYLGMGCGVALGTHLSGTDIKESIQGTATTTWETRSITAFKPAFVVYGEVGVNVNLSNRISVFAGVKCLTLSVLDSKKTIRDYFVNGEDRISDLTTAERETEYVKQWDQGEIQNPDEPVKRLAERYPASGISVTCGILVALGPRGETR